MVAISLYRGNLHRVPDVPRRWLMPSPGLSLKDFKTLLNRRKRALSCLRHLSPAATSSGIALNPDSNSKQDDEAVKLNGSSSLQVQLEESKEGNRREEEGKVENEEMMDQGNLDGGDCLEKSVDDAEVAAEPEKSVDKGDGDGKLQSLEMVLEKAAEPATI